MAWCVLCYVVLMVLCGDLLIVLYLLCYTWVALLRMDQSNALLHLAVDGLPGVYESHVDVQKRMDEHLKSSCQALKYSALHFLLGPLESFLAKVSAFIGSEIPLYRYESSEYEKNLEQDKEQSKFQ